MRLHHFISTILAKAMPSLFGSDFDTRKAHLHQEARTDKRGRQSRRWVTNAPEAHPAPKPKPPVAPSMPLLFRRETPNTLFDLPLIDDHVARPQRAPDQAARTPRTPSSPPSSPRPIPLFDFDLTTPQPKPPGATGDDMPTTGQERLALDLGSLHPGDRKTVDGVTYVLNKHHRWARDDLPQAQPSQAQPPQAQARPPEPPAQLRPADPEAEVGTDEWWANLTPGSRAHEQAIQDATLEAQVNLQLEGVTASAWRVHQYATETVDNAIDAARERLGLPTRAIPVFAEPSAAPAVDAPTTWDAPDLSRDDQFGQALAYLRTLSAKDRALGSILKLDPAHAKMMLPERVSQAILGLISGGKHAVFHANNTPERIQALAQALYAEHAAAPGDQQAVVRQRPLIDYDQWATDPLAVPKFAFDLLSRSTRATRRAANDSARKLAEQIQARATPATPEERETLARWTGQGGVSGDRNAYYTPTTLAAAMWKLALNHGLPAEARVLEPSIGGGVFAETRPQGVRMTGVEYNDETATVARALHPEVNIHTAPLETYNTTSADELFDAVIGNPPYGGRGDLSMGTTRDLDKPEFSEAEQYFLDTSLDRVKPGGLVVMLVNFGVMQNSTAREFRAHLLARAELVTAVRAPISTFEDAGAMVTPDVLVLRKRPGGVGEALAGLVARRGEDVLKAAGVYREDVLSGHYFARPERNEQGDVVGYGAGYHPDQALGHITKVTRTHHGGTQMAVEGQLDHAALLKLANMPADQAPAGPQNPQELEDALRGSGFPESDVQAAVQAAGLDHYPIPEGAISADGQLVFRGHRWHRITGNDLPAVRAALRLAKNIQALAGLIKDRATASAEALRIATREQLETYLTQYGDPGQHPDVQAAAARLPLLHPLLASVENGKVTGQLAQSIETYRLGDDVDSRNTEAVCAALVSQGRLSPAALADITGLSLSDAQAHLMQGEQYAFNGQRWLLAEDYYHGDVYQQAEALRSLAARQDHPALREKLLRQAAHFETLIRRVPIEEIDFSARDKWIPLDVVEKWLNDTLGTVHNEAVTDPVTRETVAVRHNLLELTLEGGVYTARPVTSSFGARSTWRNIREESVASILDYLNRRTRVDAVDSDLSAEERAKQRADNVSRAKEREAALKNSFRQWAFGDDAQTAIENEYNRSVNSYVSPRDLTQPFHLDGWNYDALQPHPFQWSAVSKAVAQGSSYIALDTGLGKTSTGLMLATKLKQDGRAKKPTIIVPKSVLGQWVDEVERVTPGKKVLVIGLSRNAKGKLVEDDAETKQKKLGQLAAQDWDLVIMNHEVFLGVGMRRDTRMRLITQDFERERLEGLRNRKKFKKNGEVKAKTATEAAEFATHHMDKVHVAGEHEIAFEDLGIDCLIADEAHKYKNLYSAPSVFGENIKFLGAGAESNQAMEFQHKTKFIREQNGDGSGVHCMSATPTKNSPLELYYALQYVTDELALRGIPGVEDFLDRYCEMGSVIVPDRSGTLKSQMAVTGFKNLAELRGIMDRYLIRETAQTALVKDKVSGELRHGLPMPERQDEQVYFDLHPEVAARMAELRLLAGNVNMRAPGGSGQFLRLMDEMTKLSLDPGLVSARLGALPNPRFQQAAQRAKAGLDEGGKAIIFMERGETGAGGKDAGNNAYTRLKAELVAQGIPEHQIEIVTASTAKGAERTRAADRFKSGETRVIIGNRTIEEGMNLQHGTTDMIHMDSPWDPGTYWQRLGRAWRQGNTSAYVRNHVLLARGSMDQFKFTSMLGKKGWSDMLWDPTITEGRNGDLEMQMDQLQLELAPDRLQAQSQINASREGIKAAQRAAMIKRGTNDLRTYHLMRLSLTKRAKDAARRKTGPTPNDLAALERGRLAMHRLRDQIHAGAYPFKHLTDTDQEIMFTDQGLPYTAGMQFTSEQEGRSGPWEVVRVDSENQNAFVRHQKTGHAMWMNAATLARHAANHVLVPPTPEDSSPTPLPSAA